MVTIKKLPEPTAGNISAPVKLRTFPIVLTMCLNLILAAAKGTAAFLGNSNALMADAAESLTDILTSVIVWFGIKTAVKEPDEDHPYGHGKAEAIASIIVVVFLLSTAIAIAARGFQLLWNPTTLPESFTLWVLIIAIILKEGIYRYLKAKAKNLGSSAMLAEAMHNRSDAITSLVALAGISIALIGGGKYVAADAYASLVASVIIVFNAVRIFRPALNELMDAAPPHELIKKIRQIAENVEKVKEVEKCQVRKMGMHYFVDMHVVVDGSMTVYEGHDVAHRVKDAVKHELPYIADVLVHIEPKR